MGAYEAALKYVQERMQFGKPIGSFQLVQDLLAKMHAALAKAKCRETVAWAREVLGGNGIVADYKAARFFADCEALYSY